MKHWVLVVAALCAGANAQAQNTGRITGRVTGDGALPVPQAQVSVVNAAIRAVADSNGEYMLIGVEPGRRQVTARRIGFTPVTQEVLVVAGGTVTVNFSLSSAAVQLEGLVVVAYGQQERRDVTGAITSLNMDQLRDIPLPSAAQLLQARAPGVDVVAGGSYRPGAPMQVRIRGIRSMSASNEPLYVVDGVPTLGNIEDYDPGSIESIEVLKDASATAPYGAAGANGVILITTKRGGEGGSRFSYDAQYGGSSILRFADMMNGPQLAQERIDAQIGAGRPTAYGSTFNAQQLPQAYCALNVKTTAAGVPAASATDTNSALTSTYDATHAGCVTGTDWQRLIYHPGNQQRHQIGFTSTSGASRLSLTGTYFNQNGITRGQDYTQYAGTLSFENTYGRLRIGVTTAGSRDIANIGGDASVWGEALANDVLGLPYVDTLGNATATNCTGCTLNLKPTGDALRVNPLREQQGFVRQQTIDHLFASAFAELNLGYGFSYRVNFGPDVRNRQEGRFQGSNVLDVTGQAIGLAQAGLVQANTFRYTLDNLLNWNLNTGNHKVRDDVAVQHGEVPLRLRLRFSIESSLRLPALEQPGHGLQSATAHQHLQYLHDALVHGPRQLHLREPVQPHRDRPVRRLERPGTGEQVVVLPVGRPQLAGGG